MEVSTDGTRDASRVQDKISSTVAASRTDRSCRQENRRDSLEFRTVRPVALAVEGVLIEVFPPLNGCVWSDSQIARARDILLC